MHQKKGIIKMVTKDQERIALMKIKGIIEELGEDSYIGTAFKGCFEDAQENIEYDFSCSVYDRWQISEHNLAESQAKIAELEAKDAEKDVAIATLGDKVAELVKNTISENDLKMVISLAKNELWNTLSEIKKEAEAIVEYADDPTSLDFQDSVKRHRSKLKTAKETDELIDRIESLRTVGE